MAKRVVKFLEEAAPTVPRFTAKVFVTFQETFWVEIRADFNGKFGSATCVNPIFAAWPSREEIASIGRELEAPYKHILTFEAFLGTTEESWNLDDKVISVCGCEISATSDGQLALEITNPVTNYDNIRKVIIMLRRSYPRYLTKIKASLSQPKEESTMGCTLNLV
jgi:hypothetical protein